MIDDAYVKTVLDEVTINRYWLTLGYHNVFEKSALALDVGCFVGYFTTMLPIKSVGIDNNYEYIEYARHSYQTDRTVYRCEDASRMSFGDDTFDIAYCLEMLEHIDNPDVVCGELKRVVKPGKRIVICVPAPGMSKLIDPGHKNDFMLNYFKERFNEGVIPHNLGLRYTIYIIQNDK